MNRFRVVVCLCLGWLTLAGCQSLFGSSSSRSGLSGSGPDGGACTKDPQTIKNVMLAPPMCSATNPCPCGTYCSSQTGGNCVADCVDDTWCAPGFTCSAFGQCLNANPPDGGGTSTTTNPTCPTNSALLDSLGTNPRSCQFDDVCPFGSYCNHVTELCHSDCRADSDCAGMNNPDQTFVCDCLGQCAAVGVAATPPPAFLPSLTVTPGAFGFVQPNPITTPDWGDNNARTISVSVTTQFVNKSGSTITGPKVTVQANPGPGLMVQCPATGAAADAGAGGSLSAQPCSITFDPTVTPNLYTLVNGTYVSASVSLTVAPSTGAPTATNWSLRLDSTDVGNSPRIVTLRYDNAMPTVSAPALATLTTVPTGFRGAGYAQLTTPTGQVLNIPVKAASVQPCDGCAEAVALYDDTQLLSPSGKLVLSPPLDSSGVEVFIQPTADSDIALSTTFSGAILQRLVSAPLFQNTTTGAISGSFTRSVYTDFFFNSDEGPYSSTGPNSTSPPSSPFDPPMSATFSVSPATSSAGFCNVDSDCPGGTHCDLGFCSSGPPRRTLGNAGTLDAQFQHNPMRAWGASLYPPPTAGFESFQGFLSVFAPDSFTANAVKPYVSTITFMNGPNNGGLPFISGEPIASMYQPLFSSGGSVDEWVTAFNNGPLAVPLLTQHDGTNVESASQLLTDCLNDLVRTPDPNRSQSGEPGFPSDTYDMTLNCINLGRVVGGLQDQLTFQRMLEGWLTVHSFVGREGLEEAQAAQSLTDVGAIGVDTSTTSTLGPTPTYEQLLGILESGLGFVLDQSTFVNSYYTTLSGVEIWSSLDYRTQNFPLPTSLSPPPAVPAQLCNEFPPNNADCNTNGQLTRICSGPYLCVPAPLTDTPQYQQSYGVPTFILQTATAYLRVLQAYLQNVAAQAFGQAPDNTPSSSVATGLARYGSGMRLVMAAEELAVGVNAKTSVNPATNQCQSSNSPEFAGNCAIIAQRFNAARDEMNSVRAQVVAMAQSVHDQTNPFNIPEDDVPLFFGDPSGTSSQYFAASDYLLSGWALPAVTQAQSFLDAARAAWIQQSQAAVQDELNQHNRQQEIDTLMSKYGSPILANCGSIQVPDGSGGLNSLDSTQVIPYFADPSHQFTDATNNTCFIDASCIGAGTVDGRLSLRSGIKAAFESSTGNLDLGDDPTAVPDQYTNKQATAIDLFVRSEICKATSESTFIDFPYVDLLASACPEEVIAKPSAGFSHCSVHLFDGDPNYYFDTGSKDQFGTTLSSETAVIPVAALYGPIKASDIGPNSFYLNATTPTGTVIGVPNLVNGPADNVYNYVDLRTDTQLVVPGTVSNTVAGWFQSAASTCGNGKDGHLTHDYPRLAATGFPASCYKGGMGVAYGQIQSDQLKVQAAQQTLSGGQSNLAAQGASCTTIDMANAEIEQLGTQATNMTNDYQLLTGIVNGVEAGLSGGVTGCLISGLTSLFGDAASDAEQQFQTMNTEFDNDEKATACWNQFGTINNSLATAATDVQIAVADVNTQMTTFNNLKTQNLQNISEGIAILQQEQADPVGSLGHQFWVDERITQYQREFDWARRLTYLAMLAVEYEFQQTLPYRSQIVSATTPAQMQDAVIALQQEEVSRAINLRRPQSSSIVLSVRDDVLKLSDDSDLPEGERNWTPAQRFESRLGDPAYAYHDSQGNYLGQAIPFTLNPTGVLQTRCGERVWDVTATIQGDGIEASAPGASVLLLKRNTFESQYCSGHAPTSSSPTTPGTPLATATPQMQLGVIHDSADLFQSGASVNLTDSTLFTAALLYPWFNIPKTEFYATSYQNGSSEELAGRGLYGDYVLLFPQQVLNSGFDLANVEDVLLRLDYLSIDNLSQ